MDNLNAKLGKILNSQLNASKGSRSDKFNFVDSIQPDTDLKMKDVPFDLSKFYNIPQNIVVKGSDISLKTGYSGGKPTGKLNKIVIRGVTAKTIEQKGLSSLGKFTVEFSKDSSLRLVKWLKQQGFSVTDSNNQLSNNDFSDRFFLFDLKNKLALYPKFVQSNNSAFSGFNALKAVGSVSKGSVSVINLG